MKDSTISTYMIPRPVTANQADNITDLIYLMKEKGVSHLLIEDDDFKLVGVVSKDDLLKEASNLLMQTTGKVYSKYILNTKTAKEIMSPNPVSVSPDDSLDFVSMLMMSKYFHCLPVVKDGKAIGIVTSTDLLLAYFSKPEKTS